MKHPSISVLIPTRNRATLLGHCLQSLVQQTTRPHEVIIINNASSDNTMDVIKIHSRHLRILVLDVDSRSYPLLYNSGIEAASSDVIAILDDDCRVDKHWVRNITSVFLKTTFPCVVQGRVIGYPLSNPYAAIMSRHYKEWLKSNFIDKKRLSVLDTKNVAFPARLIKSNLFLTQLSHGSHDIELAKRLTAKDISIIYHPEIKAWHKERTTLLGFISQHWRIARSEAQLNLMLSSNQKVEIMFSRKNAKSFGWLVGYLLKKTLGLEIKKTLHVLFLYFILIVIRLGGYGYVMIQTTIQGAVAASYRLQSVFQKFVSTVVLFLIYLGGVGPVSVMAKCFQKKFLRETHRRSSWRNIESFNSDSMF